MNELLKLLALPVSLHIVGMTWTSDGFLLARVEGDCGFNLFLGSPSFGPGPGEDYRRSIWNGFGFGARRRVVRSRSRHG